MVRSSMSELVWWRSNSELLAMKCLTVALTPWPCIALDVADGDARGEERVLAEVLEVAAAHRRAVDVHARGQHEVHAARARVAADHRADAAGERRCPTGGQRRSRPAYAVDGPTLRTPNGPSAIAKRRQTQARDRRGCRSRRRRPGSRSSRRASSLAGSRRSRFSTSPPRLGAALGRGGVGQSWSA